MQQMNGGIRLEQRRFTGLILTLLCQGHLAMLGDLSRTTSGWQRVQEYCCTLSRHRQSSVTTRNYLALNINSGEGCLRGDLAGGSTTVGWGVGSVGTSLKEPQPNYYQGIKDYLYRLSWLKQ